VLAFAARLSDVRFLRYLLASGGALAVDVSCFLALLALGTWPAAASAAGYSLGIVAHWLMSSRAVFADGVAARGAGRTRQKALFVGSALAGLALTTAIVGLGAGAGIDPRLAKLVAIGASFTLGWLLRSRIIFQSRAASGAINAR
jgi:putative flippase GtrA